MVFQVSAQSRFSGFSATAALFQLPTALDTINGISTQVAIGFEYQSLTHIDHDFFYCLLSVTLPPTATKRQRKSIVCYFVFGAHEIAIPLRDGDIILFNPLVPHCATGSAFPGAIIYSAYVSNRTVATFIAEQEQVN